MNRNTPPLKILVAPLDWGLGHATRCIPLISALQLQGCEVVAAADGAPARLLREAFPALRILPLPGYHVRYSKKGSLLPLALLQQLPRMLQTMRKERQWLEQLLDNEHFDAVISDNRPGLWSARCTTVYITHQLQILSGLGPGADAFLRKMHLGIIRRFNRLWVPDVAGEQNLSGRLSHLHHYPVNPDYLGPITRFQAHSNTEQDIDLLVLLSGPEPQRSLLEEKLLQELKGFNGKTVLVQGRPGETASFNESSAEVYSHVSATQLQQLLQRSRLVICRSGYTTLMDLLRLRVKAVLVPTPGQTEQEYLARHMEATGCFPFLKQEDVSLPLVMRKAADFHYHFPLGDANFEQHQSVIADFLALLRNK